MKVAINDKHGGFNLSDEAVRRCIELGMTCTTYSKVGSYDDPNADFVKRDEPIFGGWYNAIEGDTNDFRTNPIVIQVIEELGELANGRFCEAKIIDIPFDGLDGWHIAEYDGLEHVAENYRIWG